MTDSGTIGAIWNSLSVGMVARGRLYLHSGMCFGEWYRVEGAMNEVCDEARSRRLRRVPRAIAILSLELSVG